VVVGEERVRLAELLAALSLGIDLGFGQPMEHVLRQCLIALRLAERVGLDEPTRAIVYYTALLINVGCHTDAHEQAKWFGDDIAMKSGKYAHDLHGLASAVAGVRRLGAGHPIAQRFRLGLEFALGGHRELDAMIEHHASMAAMLAQHLELGASVQEAVRGCYEQWDGKGWPGNLAGERVPMAARVAQLAEFVEVAHRVGGERAVRALSMRQRGRQFDPYLCGLLLADPHAILKELDAGSAFSAVIDAEPALAVRLSPQQFDVVLTAVADFVELKSPFFLGHSRAVAALAGDAAANLSWRDADVRVVRRAALISALGRLGISNAIWDRPGPLGVGETERVRMHPYLTERMVRDSPALAPLGALAGQIRERLDGSGYPRGLTANQITQPARLLAAADAYVALRSPRPYRSALPAEEAIGRLRADVVANRLEDQSVRAVLRAAGHRVPRRGEGPAGLTDREIEVLRLVARGLTNRDIATVLQLSPKTVGNHVERIYLKIGASNRAMASLFAVRHGLVPEDGAPSGAK
jgi:HD-GYP domain-containing protein (c-di-GMP phosphodiesterase class II)